MLNKKKWSSAVWQILLVLFTLVFLSPMIYMVLNSFKPYSQMLKDPWGLPNTLFLDNYIKAFTQMKFFQSLYNSAFITIVSVFLIVVLGGLAAYPITRFDNRLTRFFSHRLYGTHPGAYCSDIFCYEENASDQYEDGTHPGICGRGILCSIYVSGLHPFHAGRYGGISADRRGKAVADVLEGGFSAFEACQRDTYHISDHVDLE